jgi:hypothetical protein
LDGKPTVINRDILAKLRDKEMDRKDFLKYSGLLMISVVGIKGILTAIGSIDAQQRVAQQSKVTRGYGGGKYGI